MDRCPNLVTVTCNLCNASDSIVESQAHYLDENDLPHTCGDCNKRLENLWSDMFIRGQADRLELLADYMQAHGFYSKSNYLRDMSERLNLLEPVVLAIEHVRDNGKLRRDKLEEQIRRYDEA